MNERDAGLEEAAQVLDAGLIPEPDGEEENWMNDTLQTLAAEIRALKRG